MRACSMLLGACVAISGSLPPATMVYAADDTERLPESLRIQRQVEKELSKDPVVPIERPNAHHRDLGAPSPDGSGPLPGGEPKNEAPANEPAAPHP